MKFKVFVLSMICLLQISFGVDVDGVYVSNIEKHIGNYGNCTSRSSDEYVWIRFRYENGTLTGYYRVDTQPEVTYNSVLNIALTALANSLKVNIRTQDDNWCGNPGSIRAINIVGEP